MHELDDDGALAQARGHAFDRAVARVADYKNTGNACFEQTRITAEGPRGGFLAIANEVGAGENEAAVIALNDVAEPFGARQRAHEDEEARCGQLFGIARGRAENGDAGEATFPVDADDPGLRPDFDVRCFLDLGRLLHGHVSRLLLHPPLIRVRRESCQVHPASLQVDEEQHIVCQQPLRTAGCRR